MKKFKELNWTNNCSVYNKIRKHYLGDCGDIRCSFCSYHTNENFTNKWYGGYDGERLRYPSWKLSTKNRKQWMKKPKNYKVTKEIINSKWSKIYVFYEIIW